MIAMILAGIGPLFSFLTGIAPAISGYFQTKSNTELAEFQAMTGAERDEYVAYVAAVTSLNAAKVANNHTTAAQVMIYLFGIPAAFHWGAVFITATLPLGIAIDPLHGLYATAEHDIALSFFILAPTLPIVNSLAARLRG